MFDLLTSESNSDHSGHSAVSAEFGHHSSPDAEATWYLALKFHSTQAPCPSVSFVKKDWVVEKGSVCVWGGQRSMSAPGVVCVLRCTGPLTMTSDPTGTLR